MHSHQERKSCHSLPLLSKWILWPSDPELLSPLQCGCGVGTAGHTGHWGLTWWMSHLWSLYLLGEVLGHTYSRPNSSVHSQVLVLLPHFTSFITALCWWVPQQDRMVHTLQLQAVIFCVLSVCLGKIISKMEKPHLDHRENWVELRFRKHQNIYFQWYIRTSFQKIWWCWQNGN